MRTWRVLRRSIRRPSSSHARRIRPSILFKARAVPRPVRTADMGQPTLKVEIKEDVLRRLTAQAERHWPGHGDIGRDRLLRDGLKRYVRYSDGKTGTGSNR